VRGRWVVLLATATALTVSLLVAAANSAAASSTAKRVYCEHPHSSTLLETRKVRIFAMPAGSVAMQGRPSIAGRPVFGCLRRTGQTRLLNAPGKQYGFWFGVDEHALAIHAPLAAYAFTAYYTDTHRVFVRVRNLKTNTTVRGCPAGGGSSNRVAFPSVPTGIAKIVLNGRGAVAWSAEGGEFGTPFAIVACDSSGKHVLDSGEGIDLESLSLQDGIVSWLDDGSRREARLE
jgi:hypothetical protein